MVGVAFRELIPRALEYDINKKAYLPGTYIGMGIMATSIVLIEAFA